MATPRYANIDAYLATLDAPHAATLGRLTQCISSCDPEIEALIAWNVPHFRVAQGYVAGLSAFKRHLTFNPWSQAVLDAHRPRLEGMVVNKHTFQFPVDWAIDEALVQSMVAARLAELRGA